MKIFDTIKCTHCKLYILRKPDIWFKIATVKNNYKPFSNDTPQIYYTSTNTYLTNHETFLLPISNTVIQIR